MPKLKRLRAKKYVSKSIRQTFVQCVSRSHWFKKDIVIDTRMRIKIDHEEDKYMINSTRTKLKIKVCMKRILLF